VCHALLQDPAFFRFLQRIDEEFAAETRRGRCCRCTGALHTADYPRKPGGCPASVIEDFSSRYSFTCGRCEKRATPASVRFLGRRVYVAVVLMLMSPRGGAQGRVLCELLTIPERTLDRWRAWWTRDFSRTPFWQAMRERFAVPIEIVKLPQSLLARFDKDGAADQMMQLLRFVSPLSTRAVII